MDNKEKKQMTIFKSVQITKDTKEKYFKVQREDISINNKNNVSVNYNNGTNSKNNNLLTKNNDNQEQTNHIFITHKDSQISTNTSHSSKKGNYQNNNNGIFITTMNKSCNINKKSLVNNNNIIKDNKYMDESLYKTKLNLVYFESIKKLCNHLNQNFNQLTHKDKISNINEYLTQMYQNLQILNKKIELITNKQSFRINKEDYETLNILLNHLIYMNKILNNKISKNIVDIYSNLNNFCNICNCST
jgi:hypothetical protein